MNENRINVLEKQEEEFETFKSRLFEMVVDMRLLDGRSFYLIGDNISIGFSNIPKPISINIREIVLANPTFYLNNQNKEGVECAYILLLNEFHKHMMVNIINREEK